jgi:signal transduction histidine kinase
MPCDWQNAPMGSPTWRRLLDLTVSLAVPAVAGVYVAAVTIAPLRPASAVTTYPQLTPGFAMLDLAAGAGLVAVGAATWFLGRRIVGLLAMLGGVCWFGADWAGYSAAPAWIRLGGMVLWIMTLPVLVHLCLHASWAVGSRKGRVLVGSLYLGTGLMGMAWAFWYVPGLDPRCLELCGAAPFRPRPEPGIHHWARMLSDGWHWLTLAAGAGLAIWASVRLTRASATARRVQWPVLVPAIAIGLTWAGWALASLQVSSLVPPTGPVLTGAFVLRAVAILSLAGGLGWSLLRARRSLSVIRRISWGLAPFPGGGTLRSALAAAVGDPGLRLVFPLSGSAMLVGTDGRPITLGERGPETHVIAIRQGREVVAMAVSVVEPSDGSFERDLGAAVRLAAANERLFASVRHEVLELQASRSRIVATGDAERHRLERDLHDGAQQRMLGVLYELTLAGSTAQAAGDVAGARQLEQATADADAAIEALRVIARGIHHAMLTEAGLVAALEALAVEAPIPVEFDTPSEITCSPDVQATIWRTVSDIVSAVARQGAVGVQARLGDLDEHITLDLAIDGVTEAVDLVALEDRVGAGGGSMSSVSGPGNLSLHVELPCA